MVEQRLRSWLAGQLPVEAPALPALVAPSLEDLVVVVDPPREPTREELLARYEALLRERAPRRQRAEGERTAAGDELLIDVVGSVNGRVLPLSTHTGLWIAALPSPPLPTFGPGLVGLVVGGRASVSVMLPFDYPIPELRGEIASFDVLVREALELRPLDPDAPGFLSALGRGETLEQVMGSLLTELREQAANALRQQVIDRALDLLCERAPLTVPEALIDEELWRRWAEHEGALLLERGLPEAELARAQDAWVRHPGLREDARRRLHVSLALGAIAARDGVVPTRENATPYLAQVAEGMGLELEQAREALRQNPAQAAVVFQQIHHLLVVDHVLSKVQIREAEAQA